MYVLSHRMRSVRTKYQRACLILVCCVRQGFGNRDPVGDLLLQGNAKLVIVMSTMSIFRIRLVNGYIEVESTVNIYYR